MRNKGFRSSREGVSNDRHHEERAVPPCVPGLGATAAVAAGALAGCSPAASAGDAKAGGDAAGSAAAGGETQYAWEVVPDPITDVTSTVDTDILVIGAGLAGCACAGGGREGRQGDRRREDVQLERPRRRLRRHQLALHGRAGHRGGQGERQAALDRPVREPRERGPHREVLQQPKRRPTGCWPRPRPWAAPRWWARSTATTTCTPSSRVTTCS
ncbi:MAG: hypothetical protein ACLTMP_00595 [Eggerthella lenta]